MVRRLRGGSKAGGRRRSAPTYDDYEDYDDPQTYRPAAAQRKPAKSRGRKQRFSIKYYSIGAALGLAGWVLWGVGAAMVSLAENIQEIASVPVDATRTEATLWNVSPDPPPSRERFQAAANLVVPMTSPLRDVWVDDAQPRFCVLSDGHRGDVFHVWDLSLGRKLYELNGNPGWRTLVAISPDGHYLAGLADDRTHAVVASSSGEPPLSLNCTNLLRFLPDDQVMTAWGGTQSGGSTVEVWDLKSRQKLRDFRMPFALAGFRPGPVHVSPGGKFLATVEREHLFVFKVEDGTLAGQIPLPQTPLLGVISVPLHFEQLRFSHDGTRLAALFRDGGGVNSGRLLCWDMQTGKGVGDYQMPMPRPDATVQPFIKDLEFAWRPDDKAWLFGRRILIDAESGRKIRDHLVTGLFREVKFLAMVDEQTLAVELEELSTRRHWVELIRLPYTQEEATLKAMHSSSPAWLRPGQQVNLQINITKVRHGTKEQVDQVLRQSLTAHLAALGLTVADVQSPTLEVMYSEQAGDVLHVVKPDRNPFLVHSREDFTGETITGTEAAMGFAWRVSDRNDPVWEDVFTVEQDWFQIRGPLTDEKVHDEALKQVGRELSQFTIAYFLPKQEGLTALPSTISVAQGRPRPPRNR